MTPEERAKAFVTKNADSLLDILERHVEVMGDCNWQALLTDILTPACSIFRSEGFAKAREMAAGIVETKDYRSADANWNRARYAEAIRAMQEGEQ